MIGFDSRTKIKFRIGYGHQEELLFVQTGATGYFLLGGKENNDDVDSLL